MAKSNGSKYAPKKPAGELPVYIKLTLMANETYRIVENVAKEAKIVWGHEAMRNVMDAILLVQHAHDSNVAEQKAKYIQQIQYKIKDFTNIFKVLYECRLISKSQMANIACKIGEIQEMLGAWFNKYSDGE